MTKSSSLIELKGVVKSYQMGETTTTVLHGIDMQIQSGDMVAIMGASGSGKSTIMNIVGLLDRPTEGRYFLNGDDVSDIDDNKRATVRNQTIGFIFQQFYLLSKLSATNNVALPLMYRGGMSKRQIGEQVQQILDKVGMADRTHHRPNELSGGQQQRVAIARALVGEPDLLLADEPTGALDSKTGKEVMELFIKLNQEERKTVVIVTHDPNIGAQCNRIIHIKDGEIVN